MMDTIIPKILTFSLESSYILMPSYFLLCNAECCTRTLYFCNLQAEHYITHVIPPAVKGLVGYTDGSRTLGGARAIGNGQSLGRRLSISLGEYAAVFQAEIYAILACAYDIQMNNRPEKYVSIFSD